MNKRIDHLKDTIAFVERQMVTEENQNKCDYDYLAKLRDKRHFLKEWLDELESGAVKVDSSGLEDQAFRTGVTHG